jgi:hypothetical protein
VHAGFDDRHCWRNRQCLDIMGNLLSEGGRDLRRQGLHRTDQIGRAYVLAYVDRDQGSAGYSAATSNNRMMMIQCKGIAMTQVK